MRNNSLLMLYEHMTLNWNHLSVLDFKKHEREKEVKQLGNEVDNKCMILEWRKQDVAEIEDNLDMLGTELQNKSAEVEQLDSTLFRENYTILSDLAKSRSPPKAKRVN